VSEMHLAQVFSANYWTASLTWRICSSF